MDLKVHIDLEPKTIVKVFLKNRTVDVIKFAKKYFGCIYRLLSKRYGNIEYLETLQIELMIADNPFTLFLTHDSLELKSNEKVLYIYNNT